MCYHCYQVHTESILKSVSRLYVWS